MKKVKVNQKHTPTSEEKAKKKEKVLTIRKMNKSSIALEKYLKDNGLDPNIDWTKDPEHGPTIKKILTEIQDSRAKLEGRILKTKEVNKLPQKKVGDVQKNVYKYPENLDNTQKKRFRTKMRSLLRGNAEISDATKKALEYALQGSKNTSKEVKAEKPKSKDKSKKKAKSREIPDKPKKVKKIKKTKHIEED